MHNISFEALRGALILLPGFTWSLIWMKYSKNKPQTDKFYFAVYAIVASAFNYLLYYLFIEDFDGNNFIKILDNGINKNDLYMIIFTTLISFFVASLSVYFSHKTPIWRLMTYLKIAPKRDSEKDVLVSRVRDHMKLKEYALIRLYDFNNNRIYQGKITMISEPKKQMEFIICNCDIYDNNTGKFLLTMKELYLNLNIDNLLIEFIKYEKRRESY